MASTITSNFLLQGSVSDVVVDSTVRPRRRRISPEAGRALEILGHAIEYLADEYVHHGSMDDDSYGQVQAMHLLMSFNRGIYLECPEIPTLGERCAVMWNRLWSRKRAAACNP